jgi:hypothetical protein
VQDRVTRRSVRFPAGQARQSIGHYQDLRLQPRRQHPVGGGTQVVGPSPLRLPETPI